MKTFLTVTIISFSVGFLYSYLNKPKHQQVQTVEVIQSSDTTVYTGIINETQYYIKIFDTTGNIQTQIRGNFKINYIKTATK